MHIITDFLLSLRRLSPLCAASFTPSRTRVSIPTRLQSARAFHAPPRHPRPQVGRILYSADYGIRWLLYATYAVITHSRGNPSKEPGTAVLSAVLGAYETTDARAEALSIHSHWMLRHACGNGWDEHVRLLLTSGYGTEVAAFRALTKSRAARSPSHSLLAHVLSQGHAGVLRAILDHGYASPASRATVPLVAVSSMLAAAAAAGHAGALEVFLERWWSSEEERALALAACDHEALLGAIRSRQPECVALLLRLSAAGGPGSAPQLSNMRDGAHELRCLARECEGCGCGSCPACATLSRLRQAAPLQVERLLEEVPSEGVTAATGAAGQAAAREEEAEERGHAADGATSRAAGRWACRAAVDGELVLELTEALDADGVAIPVVPECSPPVDTSSAFAGF